MERMQEIRDASEAFLSELLEERAEKAKKSFERQRRVWEMIFRRQLDNLMALRNENTKNMVISCLNSSVITGSHVYQIAWHDEELYVEPSPPCLYYTPEFMLEGIGEDTDRIRDFLRHNFIRLLDYEVEEIRRDYMKKLLPKGEGFFRQMLPIADDGELPVWFGEYMKNAVCIGRI